MGPPPGVVETFAPYLARQYAAKQGFEPGTVPEAAALAQAADLVLTLADGMTIQILCLIDAEAHPEKRFTLAAEEVIAIGRACARYCGRLYGAKLPVTIRLIEIGRAASEEERRRLSAYGSARRADRVKLSAWIVDPDRREVWTNAGLFAALRGRRFIGNLLARPREPIDERPPAPALEEPPGQPKLTFLLLAVLAAVFALELAFSVEPATDLMAPSPRTLVALGGLIRGLVTDEQQWYRLITAAVLHADLLHLFLNGYALYLAGLALERRLGMAWLAGVLVLGAVTGSLGSLALNQPDIVSVGASGAILALFACGYVLSFRFRPGGARNRLRMELLQVLIPSLIPVATAAADRQVDFGAHLGGAVGGALTGLLLIALWPAASALPRARPAAAALASLGVAVLAVGGIRLAGAYPSFASAAVLIPASQLPKTDAEAQAPDRAAALVQRFPHDPRARYFLAVAHLNANEPAEAEQELRLALAEEEILRRHFKPEFSQRLKTTLAIALDDRGQEAEAKAVAQPICAAQGSDFREMLAARALCD